MRNQHGAGYLHVQDTEECDMKTMTFTNRTECKHLNGWYVTMDISFLWFFTVKKRIFVCSDCGYGRNA